MALEVYDGRLYGPVDERRMCRSNFSTVRTRVCDRIREAGCKQECASRRHKIEHGKGEFVMGLDSFVREQLMEIENVELKYERWITFAYQGRQRIWNRGNRTDFWHWQEDQGGLQAR